MHDTNTTPSLALVTGAPLYNVEVRRLAAPSGNRDNDYFRGECECGWVGPLSSNRTIEGRRLAYRDVDDHRRRHAKNNDWKQS